MYLVDSILCFEGGVNLFILLVLFLADLLSCCLLGGSASPDINNMELTGRTYYKGSYLGDFSYKVPYVSSLEGKLDSFKAPLERHDVRKIGGKGSYRYNIAFLCKKVPEDIMASDVPQLRTFIGQFKGDLNFADSNFICFYGAYLMVPTGGPIKGGIVWLHGSGGVTQSTIDNCNHFVNKGYVVLCPDLFFASGTHSTIAQQLNIPLENSILAAYQALFLLKTCRALDGNPIGLVGESRGGIVTDLCARRFYQEYLSSLFQFDRFVVVNGFPLFSGPVEYPDSPILLVHGRHDDWTPLAHTQRHRDFMPRQTRLMVFDCGHNVLSVKGSVRKKAQIFHSCSVEDRGDDGFLPLTVGEGKVIIYNGNWRLGALVPWSYVPGFIRRYFNVTEFNARETISWRHFPSFLRQYSKTQRVSVGHNNPIIRQQALAGIEDFLEERLREI